MTAWTLFFWLLLGGLCAHYAQKRGRHPFTWFFIGLFLGALGFILLFILPNKKAVPKPVIENPVVLTEISPSPISVPTSQMEKFWYYLDQKNQQYGPMSFNALRTALEDGKITINTYVWNEEMENWKPWGEVTS